MRRPSPIDPAIGRAKIDGFKVLVGDTHPSLQLTAFKQVKVAGRKVFGRFVAGFMAMPFSVIFKFFKFRGKGTPHHSHSADI